VNVAGAGREAHRVLRGGCWNNNPDNCRSARRNHNNPGNRNANNGFRVVVGGVSSNTSGSGIRPITVRRSVKTGVQSCQGGPDSLSEARTCRAVFAAGKPKGAAGGQ